MINNSIDGLVTVDGKAEATLITPTNAYGRKAAGKGPVEIEISYINNLPCDIVVVDRTGFRHKVPRVPTGANGTFIIRFLYTIQEGVYDECKHLFTGFMGTPGQELEILKSAVLNNEGPKPFRNITIGIDHVITLNDLNSLAGSLYIREADTVVSSLSFDSAPAHPYARGSISEKDYNETIGKHISSFSLGIGIEMINRMPGAQPMFTFMLQDVKKIPVSRDDTRTEGFYITRVAKKFFNIPEQKLITNYYPLSDARKLGIYASEDESKTGGDIKLLMEEELSRLKHEGEVLKAKSTSEKIKSDQEHAAFMVQHNVAMANMAETIRKDTLRHNEEIRLAKDLSEKAEREFIIKERRIKDEASECTRQHDVWVKNFALMSQDRERAHDDKIHLLEKQREELKDFYELRSTKRKDFSDVLKIISATITTMGVLILAYNKTFGKD